MQEAKKRNPFVAFYDKNYKILTILPVIFLLICLGIIGVHYLATGEIINRDITLKGGVTIIITPGKAVDITSLQSDLRAQFKDLQIETRTLGTTGFTIESDTVDATRIDQLVEATKTHLGGLTNDQVSVQVVGESLGASFYREAVFSMLLAFVFMAVVVIVYFRNVIPSLMVVFAAFADIVMPFAVMVVFDIKLSTAGIAAFLMLIGYSVDTDILLTSRVLRAREGSILDNILSAMRTGILMTATALAVVLIAFFFSEAETLRQIMLILAIGLFFDIINTWLTNAGMLRWYLEGRKHGQN